MTLTDTAALNGAHADSLAAAPFRTIFNSATGERIEFTHVREDIVRLNWRSIPGGAITEHVHPHQQERFIITAGEAHFTLNGERRVVGPGQTLDVPAGAPHSEGNPGSVEVVGVVELRPPLRTQQMFEAFAGLPAEGKTTSRGAPKNPLRLGATVWHLRHQSRATSPPVWLQHLILAPLSVLAKVFRMRPHDERRDTQISRREPKRAAVSTLPLDLPERDRSDPMFCLKRDIMRHRGEGVMRRRSGPKHAPAALRCQAP